MNYPIDINNIENIEKYENFLNISINIYSYDDNEINLIHRSNYFKVYEKNVNLLEYKNHIVGIKNISALLKGQVTKHKQKLYLCSKCHSNFTTKELLDKHIESCVH